MANWNNPTLVSLYTAFLTEVKERDDDAIKMFPGSNFPVDSKRWNPGTNTFQNWNGVAWVNLILSAAGGGTGSGVFPPLGTMAAQNSNAVAITGGTITGVALNAGDITAGILALSRGGTGASLALGAANTFLQSNGVAVVFGVNGSALTSLNASNISTGNLAVARMPTGGTWVLTTELEITVGSYVRLQGGSGFTVGTGLAAMGEGFVNSKGYFLNNAPLSFGEGVPVGAMMMFETACPPFWARVSWADGRTVRFTAAGGGVQGGAATHIHGVNAATLDASPNVTNAMDVGSTFRSFDSGGSFSGYVLTNPFNHAHNFPHNHPISVNTDPADSWPPFVEYLLCMKV